MNCVSETIEKILKNVIKTDQNLTKNVFYWHAFVYNITLLDPCKLALPILVSVCEKYACEFDIHVLLNASKYKFLTFKTMFFNGMESLVMVNGEIVNISDNAVHLGHTISSSDRKSISLAAKCSF